MLHGYSATPLCVLITCVSFVFNSRGSGSHTIFLYLCRMDMTEPSAFASGATLTSIPLVFLNPRRLERTGSTCEVFEAVYQRRRVFVKKLKAEFENNPLYRAAFAKEYAIGCQLTHPNLPVYTEEGETYFVMNFIDGQTLSEMVKNGDSRLTDKTFVKRILTELVDVTDYLHRRGVIHCDIKADNILIGDTTGRLTLIDLDKCYADWSPYSQGDLKRFGDSNESHPSPAVDFRGIGLIVRLLSEHVENFPTRRFRKFETECFRDNVTVERLHRCLQNGSRTKTAVVAGTIATAAGITALILFQSPGTKREAPFKHRNRSRSIRLIVL